MLPDRAGRRRGGLSRRVDRVVAVFFAALVARAELGPAPAPVGLAGPRRSLLPAWSGVVAVGVLGLLHVGLAALAGRDLRETLVVVGAVLFAILPAAVALTEAASAHPDDRADRAARRARRRLARAHGRRRRRWARALGRWARSHARLAAQVSAVTGPAADAQERARLVVRRHAARFGWQPAGVREPGLPGHISLTSAPVPADELRLPLLVLDRLRPDPALAEAYTAWLRRDR